MRTLPGIAHSLTPGFPLALRQWEKIAVVWVQAESLGTRLGLPHWAARTPDMYIGLSCYRTPDTNSGLSWYRTPGTYMHSEMSWYHVHTELAKVRLRSPKTPKMHKPQKDTLNLFSKSDNNIYLIS